MYFYVDESGQTGTSLFDESQPSIYYGVVRSKVNVDLVAESDVAKIRKKLNVDRLHAADLGSDRLVGVVREIEKIIKKYDLRFDFYKLVKRDHAAISFFDQVFDQGVNPAVPWSWYWTPLKYVLLVKVACLFELEVLKKSWEARLTINNKKSEAMLVEVCDKLLKRVDMIPDLRSREIVSNGLLWAINNPSDISYNVDDKSSRKQISPNLIGFQSVMHGIAMRLKKTERKASRIIVDRQGEFNKAQEWLADFYHQGRDVPWVSGPGLPVMDLTYMPDIPITCLPGNKSAGLEIVDVLTWIHKRIFERKSIAPELYALYRKQRRKSYYDEVSLRAIENKWMPIFENLPEVSGDDLKWVKEFSEKEERKRAPHLYR